MRIQKIKFIPYIIAILCICFGMRYTVFQNHMEEYPWYGINSETSDFFYVFRSRILIVVGILCIISILLFFILNKKIYNIGCSKHEKLMYLFLIGYFSLVVLSSLCSRYSYFVWNGIAEHYESTFVLISYFLLTVFAAWFLSKKDIINITKIFITSIALLTVIGFTQLIGKDIFATSFGTSLIVPAKWRELLGDLTYEFSGSVWNRVYFTFYNPNLVGMFSALTIPILFAITVGQKKKKNRILLFFLSVVFFVVTLGSGSKTFFFSVISSLFVLLLIFGKKIIEKKFYILGTIGILIFGSFIIFLMNGNSFIKYAVSALRTITTEEKLQAIDLDDTVNITYLNSSYKINYDELDDSVYTFSVISETGEPLPLSQETKEYVSFAAGENDSIKLSITDMGLEEPCLTVTINSIPWNFIKNKDSGIFEYVTYSGKIDKISAAPHIGLKGYEGFASGRGYIWSRTLPLLKKNFFLGSGPDTFTLEFPNDDYIAKANHGYHGITITKPHNWYLQIAVQTGVLSLLSFLIFYLLYFIGSFRLYRKLKTYDSLSYLGLGIYLGTIGYMVSGLANDSSVCVAPLFWIMIGIGISINRILNNKLKEVQ